MTRSDTKQPRGRSSAKASPKKTRDQGAVTAYGPDGKPLSVITVTESEAAESPRAQAYEIDMPSVTSDLRATESEIRAIYNRIDREIAVEEARVDRLLQRYSH